MSSDSFMIVPLSSITGTVPPRSITILGFLAWSTSIFSYSRPSSLSFTRTFSQNGHVANW